MSNFNESCKDKNIVPLKWKMEPHLINQ
jgi:hypothetical protein